MVSLRPFALAAVFGLMVAAGLPWSSSAGPAVTPDGLSAYDRAELIG